MNKRKFEITIPLHIYVTYDADRVTFKAYQDAILAARMDAEQAARTALVPYLAPLAFLMTEWDMDLSANGYDASDVGVVTGK
jgi:hypothetical protein